MAKSFLELSLGSSGINLAANITVTSQLLVPALVEKMTFLMTKLQAKAQANAPKLTGKLAESIKNPRAEAEGNRVVGKLDWGGGDVSKYAIPQEIGGKGYYQEDEQGDTVKYAINPKKGVGAYRGGKPFGKEVAAHGAIPGKKVLAFIGTKAYAGKQIFAPYVFHPPQTPKWFMRDSLAEMKLEIIQELSATLDAGLKRIKPYGL